jgi:hypothetical protein
MGLPTKNLKLKMKRMQMTDNQLPDSNSIRATNKSGFKFTEVFPEIHRIIGEINADTGYWAKRSQISFALRNDEVSRQFIDNAQQRSGHSEERVAGNMVDWWTQQITIQRNSYRDFHATSRIDEETAYWCLDCGPLPVIPEDFIATESDAISFAMEKYLEQFLIDNWANTELGKEFDIYSENDEQVGQQFPTDTGPMDILAISKDKKKYLVVELKKGRASDSVVGQIQRYMGYVVEVLAQPNQEVHGVIIALEDDLKIQRALKVTRNIEFYRYVINFKLEKAN